MSEEQDLCGVCREEADNDPTYCEDCNKRLCDDCVYMENIDVGYFCQYCCDKACDDSNIPEEPYKEGWLE